MKTVKAGLIAGRHEMPVDLYVFDHIEDPMDFNELNVAAYAFVLEHCNPKIEFGRAINQIAYGDIEILRGEAELHLYVTGLSCALAAVIRACAKHGVFLTLYHWDSSSQEYMPQRMF